MCCFLPRLKIGDRLSGLKGLGDHCHLGKRHGLAGAGEASGHHASLALWQREGKDCDDIQNALS
jgi:hypothetical protein